LLVASFADLNDFFEVRLSGKTLAYRNPFITYRSSKVLTAAREARKSGKGRGREENLPRKERRVSLP